MKYSGYSATLHALTLKRYKPRMSLTPDMWDLWWRSMSDEERQAEHDELMAHGRSSALSATAETGIR